MCLTWSAGLYTTWHVGIQRASKYIDDSHVVCNITLILLVKNNCADMQEWPYSGR